MKGGYKTGARFGRMKHSAAIRPAETVDFDALVALSERTVLARYPPFLGAKAVRDYLASGAVESFFRDSLERCFVIEEDEVTAGVGAYKGAMVDLIMIDAERQGRGLGTVLLEHLENLLFEKSAELSLESFEHNEQANTFYRKRGWLTVDRYDDKEYGIPLIRMRKRRDDALVKDAGVA